MRHIFDQYDQPENKLTHALVSSLAQDPFLLREFLRWALNKTFPKKTKLQVLEQSVPGLSEEVQEEIADKKGLPDAWVSVTGDNWCLIIESKVECGLTQDQLERHKKRARDLCPQLLVILLNRKKIPGAKVLTWRDIYGWGITYKQKSKWASLFTEYFEIWEGKMVQEGYLKNGTITKFTGIPFWGESPYTYPQAKRLLKLIIDELKSDRDLMQELGVDTTLEGRSAITGKEALYVWDFLRLKESKHASNHTNYPHLTISIHNDFANVCITVPNGVNRVIKDRLIKLEYEKFKQHFYHFLKQSDKILQLDKNIKPIANIVQRHYFSQRSIPVSDARLKFDLRTSFKKMGTKEKYQPQWLQAVYDVMKERNSNLQMQVGFEIEYPSANRGSIIRSPKAIQFYKDGLRSLNNILKVLLNR